MEVWIVSGGQEEKAEKAKKAPESVRRPASVTLDGHFAVLPSQPGRTWRTAATCFLILSLCLSYTVPDNYKVLQKYSRKSTEISKINGVYGEQEETRAE